MIDNTGKYCFYHVAIVLSFSCEANVNLIQSHFTYCFYHVAIILSFYCNANVTMIQSQFTYCFYHVAIVLSFSCEANVTMIQSTVNSTAQTCTVAHRPSLIAAQIHVFAFFGAGIAMSSWSWNKASFSSWERFLRK